MYKFNSIEKYELLKMFIVHDNTNRGEYVVNCLGAEWKWNLQINAVIINNNENWHLINVENKCSFYYKFNAFLGDECWCFVPQTANPNN